jgi:AraC-like DNA-binding protein
MTKIKTAREYKLKNFTKNNFPLFISEYNETEHVLHVHDFTELVIVEYGKGIHFTEMSSHMITAGDVIVIPKNVKHGYKVSDSLKITNIIFDISFLDFFPKDFKYIPGFYSLFLLNPLQHKKAVKRKGFLTLEPDKITYVKKLTSRIIHEQREKPTGYQAICILVLADLIIFLARQASKHNLAIHTEKLSEALSYIQRNYAAHISLEQLSRVAKLSPRNFQKTFKDYIGTSPSKYIIKIRLQHAKKMLNETNLNISEIAYMNGFEDGAYFTKQFRNFFGTSPSNYRKQAILETTSLKVAGS